MKNAAPPRETAFGDHDQPERAIREAGARISTAEVSPGQEVRRGHWFVRVYISLVVLALAAFVTLALFAHDPGYLRRIDVPIAHAIQSVHLPLYQWVLTHTSDLGFSPLSVVAYVVVFVALFAVRLRLEAIFAVVPSLVADLLGGEIKQLVGRLRPTSLYVQVTGHLGGYSFPSGHVIQYTTLFGFTFYVVAVAWRGGLPRAVVLVVLGALIVLVGPSRVYLGQHWPSDVLGAYLFSGLWLAGTIEAHLYLKPRVDRFPILGHGAKKQ